MILNHQDIIDNAIITNFKFLNLNRLRNYRNSNNCCFMDLA